MDKIKKKPSRRYSVELRQKMIDTYLLGGYTKQAVWEMFTGEPVEHGKLLEWMRALGYDTENLVFGVRKPPIEMPTPEPVENSSLPLPLADVTDSPTPLPAESDLLARIQYLEKALEMSKLKEEGYALMIELAEKELAISIRKK
jgi:transposase